MKNGAIGFVKISLAREALKLSPGLAAGVTIGADIAAAEPALVGTSRFRTEVSLGVDGSLAASGEGENRWWRGGRLGRRIGALLTSFTQRFVEISREWLRLFGAFSAGLVGLKRPGRRGSGRTGPPEVDHQADQDEHNQ
jgi:hypothetical protein